MHLMTLLKLFCHEWESFKVPNSQGSARIFSAVMKFWTGSDASWNLVLNLCRSMITLVSGLHSSRNFIFNTATLSRLSAAWMMSPSSFLTSAAFSMVSLPAKFSKIYALVRHSCHCREPLQKCQIQIQKFSSFQQRCLRKTKALACVKASMILLR